MLPSLCTGRQLEGQQSGSDADEGQRYRQPDEQRLTESIE
jgi:hypothetical protein